MPTQILSGLKGEVTSLAYSPDSKWLVTSAIQRSEDRTFNGGEMRLWQADTGRLERILSQTDEAQLLFAPDGKTLVTGNRHWQQGQATTSVQL